jgi:hypothetical protein
MLLGDKSTNYLAHWKRIHVRFDCFKAYVGTKSTSPLATVIELQNQNQLGKANIWWRRPIFYIL